MKTYNLKYTDLIFYTEKEFAKWFKESYYLFGIKEIIKIDPFFPDVLALMFDGSKKYIELEYHASNFREHKHYAPFCDLIISYLKSYNQDFIKGVPVVSLFECKSKANLKDIRPSKFLMDIFKLIPLRNREVNENGEEVITIIKEVEIIKEIIKEKVVVKEVVKEVIKDLNKRIIKVKNFKYINNKKFRTPERRKAISDLRDIIIEVLESDDKIEIEKLKIILKIPISLNKSEYPL